LEWISQEYYCIEGEPWEARYDEGYISSEADQW